MCPSERSGRLLRCASFFAATVFGVTLLSVGFAASPSVEVDIDPVFGEHNIFAIGHRSPQFRDALVNLVGADNAAVCEPVLPYTLIIKNSNPMPIALIVVRYPRVESTGRPVETSFVTRIASSAMSLASADGLIITPHSTLDQSLNHLRSSRPFPLNPQAAMNQIRSNHEGGYGAQRFPHGKVSLDSVVFTDGGVVGPDRLGIITVEQGQLAIESEIIARYQDPSSTDDDLKAWLTTMSQEMIADPKLLPTAAGHITLYRISLAKALLNRLNTPRAGGRASIVPTLKGLQAQRLPVTSSSNSARSNPNETPKSNAAGSGSVSKRPDQSVMNVERRERDAAL